MSSSPEPDKHPPDADAAVLRIVAGLHAGASRPLSRREMVLIGSGDDCDVVLADLGVAAHHALLNVVDGRFHLRALDAPVELPGRTLHPGDPVEIGQVQRIGLGHAAIAFGRSDATEWLVLAPEPGDDAPPRRPKPAFASRLPLIAGVAVLALAALAIFAAWMPAQPPSVDVEQRLRELAREHRVSDVKITRNVDGHAVLSGTVDNRAVRDRLRAQLEGESLPASVSLRSGEDLAVDVAEVMRTGGFPVQAEYLGNNNVRVSGHFGGDESLVRDFIRSRAMVETGVNMVEPVNLDAAADASADARDVEPAQAHVVSIVRGESPYVETADGERYQVGDAIPGWGELISIGAYAHVLQPDGALAKLRPSPAPAPPPEDEADAAQAPGNGRAATQRPANVVQKPETARAVRAGAVDADTM